MNNNIKIIDLSNLTTGRSRIEDNQISIYNKKTKGFTLNKKLSEILLEEGNVYMNIAINEFTDDKFFVFSRTEGAKLHATGRTDANMTTNNIGVIDKIIKTLNLTINKGERLMIDISDNLSPTDKYYTVKIIAK